MKTPTLALLAACAMYSASNYAHAAKAAPVDDCCKVLAPAASALPGKSIYQLDAPWTNDAGKPFHLAELRGRHVIISMFFASCRFACPVLLHDMQTVQSNLSPAERQKTDFVFVSLDTTRDTPEALHAYREANQLDEHWHLLSGSEDNVAELAAVLGVRYEKQANGDFNHSSLMTFLNSDGLVQFKKSGNQIVRE